MKKKMAFDFIDFIIIVAFCMIFYGFYIWKPFVSFIVVGFMLLVLCVGLSYDDKKTK